MPVRIQHQISYPILRRTVALLLAFVPVIQAQPVVEAVVNGASFDGRLSPGCWVSVFGSGFTDSAESAAAVPLPTSLAGVSVTVDGLDAPLGYAGPSQLNLLIPYGVELPEGVENPNSPAFGGVDLVVTSPGGNSEPFSLVLDSAAPALFSADSSGSGPALLFMPDFQPASGVNEGEWYVTYAACLGKIDPPVDTAAGGSSEEPFNRPLSTLKVFLGDELAQEAHAVLAPGFPGVFQVNMRTALQN